ncbi:MAG: CHRD domain-containing protein [Xenococcaceae cyanobacterium MO_188.B32]|nr:CHRD domain-containing protein [Xenococcaceae cyanobacterium MO_188.B32]
MKKFLKIAVMSTFLSLLQSVASMPTIAATLFESNLNSAQEVDPGGLTNSSATGFSSLELIEESGIFSLNYSLTVSSDLNFEPVVNGTLPSNDNDVTRLHIHNEASGFNGPIVFGIFDPNDDNDPIVTFNPDGTTTISGVWDPDEGSEPLSNFVPQLLAADPGEDVDLYWNLHTVADPAGEIRGQIVAVAAPETRVPEPSSSIGLILSISTGLLLRQRQKLTAN